MWPKETPSTAQPAIIKSTMTPKTVTTKPPICTKTVQFAPMITSSSSVKTVTTVWKLTPTITAIDVQDDKEAFIVAEDDEMALTRDEIGNAFKFHLLWKS